MDGVERDNQKQGAGANGQADKKMSQHAKRRLQKRLKKEQEQAQNNQQASPAEAKAPSQGPPAEQQAAQAVQKQEKPVAAQPFGTDQQAAQPRPQTAKPQYQQKGQGKKGQNQDGAARDGPGGQSKKKEYFEVSRPSKGRQASQAEEQSVAEQSNLEGKSDQSMRDDTDKLEEAKQSEDQDQIRDSRPRAKKLQVEKLPLVHVNRKLHTVTSTELGFTGPSDNWFDNDLYMTPKFKANFDEAGKHDYYFNSYSSHHIHEEMLKDTHRTTTYRSAIEGNKNQFKDKIVLDIGCGTGILSVFAARAGAKHVYAVDAAEIALFAKEIVRDNDLEDKITVLHGKLEELDLPFGEGDVDIIISEWMGYFLLYESMLDCVLWARDKFLNKETGKMLPDRAKMYLSAIEDSQFMGEKISFWDNVYDVDMSCMTKGLFRDPIVDTVPAENIMSDSCCILDLDLMKMNKGDVEFSNFYSVNALYNDNVHAFVFWFDTDFGDLENPVTLTTSPHKMYTHWKQSVLYLEKPLRVHMGDIIYGSIAVRQDRTNFRELNIKMSFHQEPKKRNYPPGKEPKAKHFVHQYKFK